MSDAQHGFYAEALRAHLRSLATGVGLGRISRSSCIVRFVQGGVVKTFRCATYREVVSILYRVYPVVLFAFCSLALIGGFFLVGTLTSLSWPFLMVPIHAAVVGYLLMMLVAGRFPRIRYIDAREIDGHGYVHQPLGPMLLICLIGFGIAVMQIMR